MDGDASKRMTVSVQIEGPRIDGDTSNTSNDDVKPLEEKGWLLLKQEQYPGAIKVFDSIFKKDKENVAAFQGKIAALRKQNDFRGANELLRTAIEVHPKEVGILSEEAWLCLAQNKYDEAINAFKTVLEVDPENEKILAWTIDSLRIERKFEEAEKLIEDASQKFPSSLWIGNQRGWLYFDQIKYDDAIAAFEEILKENPNDGLARRGKIASLRGKGSYLEATTLAMLANDELCSRHEESPDIYNELGWINYEQGYYEQAETYFKNESRLLHTDPAPHINLAWSLVQQATEANLNLFDRANLLDRAIEHCRKALQLKPNLSQAYGCLGNIAFNVVNSARLKDILLAQ